jgi:hypothetical protein
MVSVHDVCPMKFLNIPNKLQKEIFSNKDFRERGREGCFTYVRIKEMGLHIFKFDNLVTLIPHAFRDGTV